MEMKSVVFTTLLLLILGVAWTQYLEYDNKQFVERLQKVDTSMNSDTPIYLKPITVKGERSERSRFKPPLYKSHENPTRKDTITQEQTQSYTPQNEGAEEMREPLKSFSEPAPAEKTKSSQMDHKEPSENSPESHGRTPEENQKKARARSLLEELGQRTPDMVIPLEEFLKKNPDIASKLSGQPRRDVHVHLHYTHEEADAVREAVRTLNEHQ